jgi:hypothetical protein
MGFYRQGQPSSRDRAVITAAVTRFLAQEIAREATPVPHDCTNPAGHHFNGACGNVVCLHCRRVAWA